MQKQKLLLQSLYRVNLALRILNASLPYQRCLRLGPDLLRDILLIAWLTHSHLLIYILNRLLEQRQQVERRVRLLHRFAY